MNESKQKTDEKVAALAKSIFEKKELKNYYRVTGVQPEYDIGDIDMSYYIYLDDEEVKFLQDLLNESECEYRLDELEEKIPFYEKLCPSAGFTYAFVPYSIDLEHPVHFYDFAAILYEKFSGEPEKTHCSVQFSDEEYISLLEWRLKNRGESFNQLMISFPSMFENISRQMIARLGILCLPCCHPFLVFMEELDQDVSGAEYFL